MKNIVLLCLIVILPVQHSVAQTDWKVDSSLVVFHVDNAGFDVEGTIGGLKAEISFDPRKLDKSSIHASLEVNTIQSGIGLRDKHLKKYDYFDADNHPLIEMTSKSFRASGDSLLGTFILRMKETEKEVEIPFVFHQSKNAGEFKGTFDINRMEFDIGDKSMILSEMVKIEIWVSVTK